MVAFLQHGRGGAEKQAVLVAKAVQESFDITLVVAKPVCAGWRKTVMDRGFRLVVLQKKESFLERRRRNSRLLELCFRLKPDLVYSRFIDFNIFLAKKRGEGVFPCPLVIQEVNTRSKCVESDKLNRLLYKNRISRHYTKADLILCNGTMAKQDMIERFGVRPGRCLYLPNMLEVSDVDQDVRRQRTSDDTSPLRIACVGRIVEQKDYRTMLKAVQKVRKSIPIYVEVFGEGPLKKRLTKEIARYKLEDRVTLQGYVPRVSEYLRDFDFLLSCSKHEGMSNAMLEAMAVGLPVVVTDVSGTRDVIRDSEGIIFPPGDVGSLVDILERLAKDKTPLKVVAENGRQRAKDFLVSKIGPKYSEAFLSVISNSRVSNR